jgi:4-amino-4-deoxy-L-arabinose transferase-like glycosyltransferase
MRFFIMISSAPLILVLAVWILSFGGFNLITVLHHNVYLVATSFAVIIGGCTWIAEEVRDEAKEKKENKYY